MMGVGGVESKLSVQLISPKLNNFNIVIIMPDIGNDFNFNHTGCPHKNAPKIV